MILPENQWREGNGASHRLYLDTRSTVTLWACKPLSSYRTAGPFPPRAPSWLPIIAEGKHSYDLEYQLPTEAP